MIHQSAELTILEAIKHCENLKKRTGEEWYFKGNKGSIKLVCGR